MPLSQPAARDLRHLRDISVRGYRRADGLFDIEARLSDSKTYGFATHHREIGAGENLHGMALRMTVDLELTIVACEAATDDGPFATCSGGAEAFRGLAGLVIGPGFLKAANQIVGGVAGCTHLRELLQQVGTVAFQTTFEERQRRRGSQPPADLIDTCYAYAADGPVAQRLWPQAAPEGERKKVAG